MAFVKARGGGFGMDAELAAKRLAHFDTARAAVAINWLCELSKTPKFSVEQMWARLKDGHILCSAANRLQANACPKVNSSAMPFKQMENVMQGVIPHCKIVTSCPGHRVYQCLPSHFQGHNILNPNYSRNETLNFPFNEALVPLPPPFSSLNATTALPF